MALSREDMRNRQIIRDMLKIINDFINEDIGVKFFNSCEEKYLGDFLWCRLYLPMNRGTATHFVSFSDTQKYLNGLIDGMLLSGFQNA